MSARRSRSASGTAPEPGGATHSAVPSSRPMLLLAVALALSWSAALVAMDALTRPPVVVSAAQVRASALVVVARLAGAGTDRIRVERSLRGEARPGDELRVLNLAAALTAAKGLEPERSYLFSLRRFGRDCEITTLPGQKAAPLVYAGEGAALERVKSILRDDL